MAYHITLEEDGKKVQASLDKGRPTVVIVSKQCDLLEKMLDILRGLRVTQIILLSLDIEYPVLPNCEEIKGKAFKVTL